MSVSFPLVGSAWFCQAGTGSPERLIDRRSEVTS
jgi:hypothetical protein